MRFNSIKSMTVLEYYEYIYNLEAERQKQARK